MSTIKYLSISGNTEHFLKDGQEINCRPFVATVPCVAQDETTTIESCAVCGKHF